jgi:FkbM family methyltransferase
LPAERVRESNAFLPRLANWLSPARAGASRKIEAAPSPKNGLGADDLRDVYRLLLNREPDPTGFEHFSRLIQAGTIATRRELVDIIIGSTEFGAARHGENEMLEVELDGYSLFVRSNDRDIGFTISRSGVHEPHVTSVVRELLSKGQVFADVGANVGYFMALGAHIVGASGRVIAVEPMDKNLQLLYATVWRNAFANVEIHPFAASEKAALLPMATGPRTSNGQVVLGDGGRTIPSLFAQSRPMDELLRLLPRLDLLKIDIEGHELMALRGFEKGLARHRPRIITEFHPKCMRENSGIDPAEYLKFLFSYSNNAVVLHSDSTRVVCDDADAVMQEWQAADRRLASGGTTHVDLLVTPR